MTSESSLPASPPKPEFGQPVCGHSLSSQPITRQPISIVWFAITTLLGAFLVFQVQPVISKCVLPWFGGTPAVWTTCMLFFQILLFGGYLYAHVLRSCFRPWLQGCIHLSLLCAAAFTLPIEPSDAWKPMGNESPILHLLWMLTVQVGLPYFVLSSTGPLIQAWLSYQDNSDRVYRLYALSNAGSLVALLSYPFLVEPVLSVSNQSMVWSLMFCGFVLVQGVVAIGLFRVSTAQQKSVTDTQNGSQSDTGGERSPAIGWQRRLIWIALPALASTMLLVVTNHVCQDVAVIPFLWVLPLSLYLVSFIICFDSPQWYKPKWIAAMTLIAILGIQAKTMLPGSLQLVVEVTMYMTMLLGVCLLCHGEVAGSKPSASDLTQYYALLSAGGAVGGLIVAVACPMLLNTAIELPFMLSLVTSLSFLLFFACRGWSRTDYDWSVAYRLRFGAVALMALPMISMAMAPGDETITSKRNFFGTLEVLRDDVGIRLVHGSTIHGMQRSGEGAHEPTTYYGRQSGIGRLIAAMQQSQPSMHMGVVGLGCGVLASYGRETDQFDMIEINPDVVEIANQHFSFLSHSPAISRIHLGDGRLVLERMTDQRFDLLVLDAFSSDAIPAHLLTREAIALYRDRLAPNGVLAIHVSNNHLDLVPLVHHLAHDAGLESRAVISEGDARLSTQHATWMLLGDRDDPIWGAPELETGQPADVSALADAPLWTDQRHNLVSVLRLW
ncbi:spermidine synthase [Rubripirellula lacrimiformis]|uniref:Spermidine synthase n=1 Tax=Rubripirellula lacrimiformis TaxID=1930273 RepID=A0A517N698_9BACT|nr:fused MFS/spermidine synthase [Rubripirellula lacrimiformis]QDT02652.1 spermidine synthase [Rubripirellula lacrimiformis]